MPPLVALSFVAGICLLQTRAALPTWEWAAVLAVPLLLWLARTQSNTRNVALWTAVFLCGFFYAAGRADLRMSGAVPDDLEWRDVVVEGVVRGFPVSDWRRARFEFDIERAVSPPAPLKLRVLLSDYHYGKTPIAGLQNGARLRMKVRIRPPRHTINPDGFDYAGYLFARGVRASGYVRARDRVEVLKEGSGIRNSLRRRALQVVPNGELLAAFVVGDRSRMSDAQWIVLRRTGTAHLLSISGTHIALAAGFAALIGGFLWRRSCRLMRAMPVQKAALMAAAVAASGYAYLAGFEIPVQRSLLMFLVACLATFSGGGTTAPQAMSAAAVAVLMADPWAVLSPGFWLSFMLAGAVVAAASQHGMFLRRLLSTQIVLSLFAIPLTLWFFNEASLASPLANIVAVPAIGLAVLPLTLLDVIIPGDILWQAAGRLLEVLWKYLEYLSASPFASLQTSAPWPVFVLACAGAMWMLMPRGVPLRWAGVLPVFAMMLWQPSSPDAGTFRMTVLDVGQGTATAIETQSHALIYDAGPPYAANIIDSFLRRRGGRKLDMLIVSHDDSDHIGGAEELLLARSPEEFFSSLPPAHKLRKTTGGKACIAGQEWEWDGVKFMFLHPPEGWGKRADNEKSCVLKVSAPGGSALLAGDISAETEEELTNRAADELQSDILLAAHHGSRGSSSAKFLQAASPYAAIFSAGANNRFGHPHADAISRVRQAGAKIFRTDRDGAIIVTVTSNGIHLKKWSEHYRRYWHNFQD